MTENTFIRHLRKTKGNGWKIVRVTSSGGGIRDSKRRCPVVAVSNMLGGPGHREYEVEAVEFLKLRDQARIITAIDMKTKATLKLRNRILSAVGLERNV